MKIKEKLQKRLLDDLGISVNVPEKIPRGSHGKAGGQWAWTAEIIISGRWIGSEDTMTECVNCNKLDYYSEARPFRTINICAENK